MNLNKIKLPSTGGEITEREFSKRIDQIMHILNAVISCDGKQLFGYHGKTIGWCMPEMRDQVVGYKLALCKLADDDTERRRKTNQKATEEVADKVRQDLKKLTTEKKIQKEKKVALVMMKFRGQLKDLPDGSATFDKRVLKKTIKNIRRIT